MGWRGRHRLAALGLPVALLGQCGPPSCEEPPGPPPWDGFTRELTRLCTHEDWTGSTVVTWIETNMGVDATSNDKVENFRFRWRLIPGWYVGPLEDATIEWSRTFDLEALLGERVFAGSDAVQTMWVGVGQPGWEKFGGTVDTSPWFVQVEYTFVQESWGPNINDDKKIIYAEPGTTLTADQVAEGVEVAPDSGCNVVEEPEIGLG